MIGGRTDPDFTDSASIEYIQSKLESKCWILWNVVEPFIRSLINN